MEHSETPSVSRGGLGGGRTDPPSATTPVYQMILPLPLLRGLAVGSLVLSLALILLGLFDPLRFEDDVARFMLCLAVATLLAIFFFIFYPENIGMRLPLSVGTTVRLAGPVALWVGVFLFLWQFIPSPEYGRVFEIWSEGRRGGMYLGDQSTTYFTRKQGKPPEFMLIGSNNGSRDLFGIYVLFPRNVRKIDVLLHHEGWVEPLPVRLSRDGDPVIDVSPAQKKRQP